MRVWLAILVIGALCPLSADVHITLPEESSKQVVITASADGKSSATYKNSVWVNADDNVKALAVIPTELTGPSGSIPKSAIHVNFNPASLEQNTPKELVVSVDTTLTNGDFKGDLVLVKQGQTVPLDRIPLLLRLTPKPNVITSPTGFAFKATACDSWITCWIADLLPEELRYDWRTWQLVNLGPAPVDWTSAVLILRGDKTGTTPALGVNLWRTGDKNPAWTAVRFPETLLANAATAAQFRFERGEIEADHYQGQYRIVLKGGDPITVPFTLDVRDGPWLAILTLVGGIVLGRIIQSINAPRVQTQFRLLDRLRQLTPTVNGVSDSNLRQELQNLLSQAMIDIQSMSRPEADISARLDLISQISADSAKLDQIASQIQTLDDPQRKARLEGLLDSARQDLLGLNVTGAEKTLSAINAQLAGADPPSATAFAFSAPSKTPRAPVRPNLPARFLSWAAGSEPLGAEFAYVYVRPFLFVLLLVLLAATGLYNSYFKNATFGVEGPFDYLSLFLWGISADVAQKTLQNLTLSRNP